VAKTQPPLRLPVEALSEIGPTATYPHRALTTAEFILASNGDWPSAVIIGSSAARIPEQHGVHEPWENSRHKATIDSARSHLEADALNAAWSRGLELDLEDAVELAVARLKLLPDCRSRVCG
jgi:hypothetical protein